LNRKTIIMSFENLNLIEPITRALKTKGYIQPTPIQAKAIPVILSGKDILGCAQTGTGKTAAFAIPILQILHNEKASQPAGKNIRSLILTPTRELALQIDENIAEYGKHTGLKHAVIFGGVSYKSQIDALRRGIDILVATPGRLLDLMNQKYVHLEHIELFVLDEADRMLDMGFINDVKKVIAKLSDDRQTMLFSATMPTAIKKLAAKILNDPQYIAVTPPAQTVDLISQSVYYVDKKNKKSLLLHLLQDTSIDSALVFTRTKHGANKVVEELNKKGIKADAIHGNKSQSARQSALTRFKKKQTRVLVATDIASRGIDVEDLSHVINYEMPEVPETYVHRIGRTGRAGASGVAISFCDSEEKGLLKDINKLISQSIPVAEDNPFPIGTKQAESAQTKTQSVVKKDNKRSSVPAKETASKVRTSSNSNKNTMAGSARKQDERRKNSDKPWSNHSKPFKRTNKNGSRSTISIA
jgi:ATP-dependent RNA helicase RhlE